MLWNLSCLQDGYCLKEMAKFPLEQSHISHHLQPLLTYGGTVLYSVYCMHCTVLTIEYNVPPMSNVTSVPAPTGQCLSAHPPSTGTVTQPGNTVHYYTVHYCCIKEGYKLNCQLIIWFKVFFHLWTRYYIITKEGVNGL